jgi:hypothetical protein
VRPPFFEKKVKIAAPYYTATWQLESRKKLKSRLETTSSLILGKGIFPQQAARNYCFQDITNSR